MASVEQVIKHILARQDEFDKRLAALEAGRSAPDEWTAEIDVDLSDDDDLTPGERAQVESARRRLKEDDGQPIESELEPTQVKITTGIDGAEAWFPTATDEQIEQRTLMVDQVGLEELEKLGLVYEEAKQAWITGGPLWLHAYDRDHVLSLPPPVKQAMVLDAMLSSNRDAQELGRDILKDESPGTPDITVEAIG